MGRSMTVVFFATSWTGNVIRGTEITWKKMTHNGDLDSMVVQWLSDGLLRCVLRVRFPYETKILPYNIMT